MTSPIDITINPAPVLIGTGEFDPDPDVLVIPVPGPSGSVGGYTHVQSSPSASWLINHNLGRYPLCQVLIDIDGDTFPELVIADVEHNSVNQTAITFPSAQTGRAVFI